MRRAADTNKTNSCSFFSQVEDEHFLKVNEIINSIYAKDPRTIQSEFHSTSSIVSELIHNDLIIHINSLTTAKLLALELIIFIAEESATKKPRISLLETALDENKKIRAEASLRNNLESIKELL